MSDAHSRDQNKFIVRMPEGMRDRLKDEAARNNRSLNAEIVARLEASERPQAPLASQATELFNAVKSVALTSKAYELLDERRYSALHRYCEEAGVADFEAIDAILTDWLIGHGYLKD